MEVVKRTGFTDFLGSEHCSWIVRSGKWKYYFIDFNDCLFETGKPETMAFQCDKDGRVLNWDELAISYDSDADKAMRDCIDQLRKKGLIYG